MKKLTPEETQDMLFLSGGRETMLSAQLKELAVGEGLYLPAAEWKSRTAPYRIARYIAEKHGRRYTYGRMTDGSGWVFKRVE